MSGIIEAKKQLVEQIADQLKNSVSTVIVNYRGLTVAEVTELRKQLREAGVEYKVYKNTMINFAIKDTQFEGLGEYLSGPTAVAFSYEDATAAPSTINAQLKSMDKLEFKNKTNQSHFD